MGDQTTIVIDKKVREEIKKFGYKEETYNDIIKRLIQIAEKTAFFNRQERILKEERFVLLDEI